MQQVAMLAALALLPFVVHANGQPYAGQERRTIKALSEQDIADYRNGRGMGSSKVAELNHYPGPRHVLDHAAALGLSAEQQARIQRIHDEMAREAAGVGERIVQKESQLEALFAAREANPDNTRQLVNEIAALQAEFRLAHLKAHLSTREVLSQEQVAAYDRIRGYTGTKMHKGGHSHGMMHGNTSRD
ncbi:MAG TPA: periplasmic heavy metal sensor [Noviherbaspirillum sp.]|nr:periplasmic heavy metal sensor [Noviherbaspirillum sp.]